MGLEEERIVFLPGWDCSPPVSLVVHVLGSSVWVPFWVGHLVEFLELFLGHPELLPGIWVSWRDLLSEVVWQGHLVFNHVHFTPPLAFVLEPGSRDALAVRQDNFCLRDRSHRVGGLEDLPRGRFPNGSQHAQEQEQNRH